MASIEPVEIEFLMRENITQQTKQVDASLQNTASVAESAAQEIQQKIEQQQAVINKATAMLDQVDARAKRAGTTSNKELIDSVLQQSQAQRAALQQQQQALNGVSADTAQLNEVTAQLASRLKEVTQMMIGLANAGERNSSAYQKLAEEQNLLNDALGNTRKTATAASESLSMPATALKERIIEEKAAIEQIKLDIASLNQQLKTASPAQKVSIQADLGSAQAALVEEKNVLLALEQQAEKTGVSFASLRQQLMNIRNEMGQMMLAGQEDTEMYRQKEAELQRLGVVYRKMQTIQTELTHGGSGAKALGEGVMAVSGAFTAAQGVMSLFASKNEDLEKIEKNLQAAMSITIGLSMTMQMLHQTSAFRIAVVTKATQAWTAAQEFLNVQLGISAVLSKALMLTGIGLLIAGIGLLVAAIEKTIKAEQERQKLAQIGMNLDKAAAENTATHRAALDALLSALHNEASSLKTKKEALEKIKEIIPEYNATISQTGKITNENTTAINNYIEALGRQSLAEAAQKSMEDIYQRQLKNKIDQAKAQKDIIDAETTKATINSQAGNMVGGGVAGSSAMNISQNIADQQVQLKRQELAKLQYEGDSIQKELDLTKDVLAKNSDALFVGEKTTKTSTAKTPTEKAYDPNDLVKKNIEYQQKIDAAVIAAMHDGSEKRKAEAKKEYQDELDYITIQRKEIQKQVEKANQTKNPEKIAQANKQATIDNGQLDALAVQAKATYQSKVKMIDDASTEAITAIFDDVNAKFQSELDRNLVAIDKYYKEQIKKAQAAGASIAQINTLYGDWDKEIKMAGAESKSKQLDFQEQIELGKQQIANRAIASEATRQENILNIQKAYLLKQKALLEKQPQTDETKNKLAQVNLAIQQVDAQLKEIPQQKMVEGFQKASQYARDLGNALQGVNQEAAAFVNMIGQMADGMAQIASGDTIGGALSIASTLVSTIFNQKAADWQRQMDFINKLFENMNMSVDNMTKKISTMVGTDALSQILATFKKISDSIWTASSQLDGFYFVQRKVGTTAKEVQKDVEKLAAANWFANLTSANTSLSFLNAELKDTQKAIDDIIKRLGEGGLSKEETDILNATLQELQTQQGNLQNLLDSYKQTLTGTTSDSIVNSIADAFANSKSTITDFANTFQDLMKNAVISSLKTQTLEGPLKDWYNTFAQMSEKGLTADDVTKLRDMYNKIIGNAQTEFTMLQNVTGVQFPTASDANTLSGSIKGMSEDTATALEGSLNSLRLNVATMLQNNTNGMTIMQKSLDLQGQIAVNTKDTVEALKTMYWMMNNWDLNGIKVR